MKRARSINRLTVCWSVFNGSKCLCSECWGCKRKMQYLTKKIAEEKILSFGVLYLNIINNEIDYREIIKSDFSEIFGFKYNLFLENYQSLEGINPQKWFPLLSQNKTFPLLREKG